VTAPTCVGNTSSLAVPRCCSVDRCHHTKHSSGLALPSHVTPNHTSHTHAHMHPHRLHSPTPWHPLTLRPERCVESSIVCSSCSLGTEIAGCGHPQCGLHQWVGGWVGAGVSRICTFVSWHPPPPSSLPEIILALHRDRPTRALMRIKPSPHQHTTLRIRIPSSNLPY
jgi:hypothetical protein